MAESINSRLLFPQGKQRQFVSACIVEINSPLQEIATFLGVSVRTLMDWRREKFLITTSAAEKLSKKAHIPLPKNSISKDPFWYAKKGAQKGGLAVYKKYGRVGGSPEHRKAKWQEWWDKEGKFKEMPVFEKLSIHEPEESETLAEFVGIVLGDGGITERQVTITLHHEDDKEYGDFVQKMIMELFGVQPSIYHSTKYSVNNYVVSRSKLVEFCVQKLGLHIGHKIRQQVDMPEWIKKNKAFQRACVRGLVDTDGSVFTHRYKVGGKQYSYKKIDYTSLSRPLLKSAYEVLKRNGIHARPHRGKSLRIDSIEDMKKYFQIIGTHNPKHLKRYCATPILR